MDIVRSTNLKSVGYVFSEQLLRCVCCLPKVKGRALLVDSLIRAYNLNEHVKQLQSLSASEYELLSFHSKEYIEHIKLLSNRANGGDVCDETSDEFGISYDCPALPHLYEIISQIAGSSLTAAKAISSGECRLAINWFGGWHHSHRDQASGFCYVNDIVLAILYLLSHGFKKILYIDLDLHHGDAVEAAFAHTSKVMTVSLHKYELGFFPGSGSLNDNTVNCVNVPLRDGIDDEMYVDVFARTLSKVQKAFAADVIICQCGGDTLVDDPMNCFNLTLLGIGKCIRLLMSFFDCPCIFVGGGGYNVLNTSRLWAYLTSIIVGVSIDNEIPDHSYFLLYRPSYELHIEKGNRKNVNDASYIDAVLRRVLCEREELVVRRRNRTVLQSDMNSNCFQHLAMESIDYQCKPIYSFDELQKWRSGEVVCFTVYFIYFSNEDEQEEKLYSTVPPIAESVSIDGPKVLLCHDMKGGYLEDRYVRGSQHCDVYTFFHWPQIDLFVYFSHHLVTIPPITWTTAAHRNGVPILGTFITEGSNGSTICRQMLSSPEIIAATVNQLVNICEKFKFEGWLINIENQVQESDMNSLLTWLTSLTRTMHERIPGSKVIWYDSILYPSGNLSWQNELNSKNMLFFEACDAIFLNYGWSKNTLQNSVAVGEQRGRKYDIFVGIDVFGRGCYGGGGMNTNLAVQQVSNMDLSMAIFAPGWVHEILGSQHFHENQLKFWSKLNLPVRRLLSCLPFESNFCRGFGKYIFKNGQIQSSTPWCNLMVQDIQTLPQIPLHMDDGFEGGGCLLISDNCNVLNCYITVPHTGCLIILVYKPWSAPINVSLLVTSALHDEHSVVLMPIKNEQKNYFLKLLHFNVLRDEAANEINGWLVDLFLVEEHKISIINKVCLRVDDGENRENSLLLGCIKILKNPNSQVNEDSIV